MLVVLMIRVVSFARGLDNPVEVMSVVLWDGLELLAVSKRTMR